MYSYLLSKVYHFLTSYSTNRSEILAISQTSPYHPLPRIVLKPKEKKLYREQSKRKQAANFPSKMDKTSKTQKLKKRTGFAIEKLMYLLLLITIITTGCTKMTASKYQGKVIELVIWKPINALSDTEILEKAKMANQFIEVQEGFLYRDIAKNENGEWLDFLYWDNMEHAKAAAKAAQSSEHCQPFFAIINMKSMQFHHFASKSKNPRQ